MWFIDNVLNQISSKRGHRLVPNNILTPVLWVEKLDMTCRSLEMVEKTEER